MKILELCLSPDLGGLELYMFRTAKELSARHQVLAVINKKARLKQYLQNENIKLIELPRSFRSLPIISAFKLASIIDKNGIDLVHMHWGKDLPLAALAKAISKRKPRLVYTRQMQMTRSKDDWYHNFQYRQMDLMLTITDKLAEEARSFLRKEFTNKIQRLYYGVEVTGTQIELQQRNELRQQLNVTNDEFIVGLFGRIKESKGQYLLIEAIKKLNPEHNNIKALIVGRPMNESYLKKLQDDVKASGVCEQIIFKGFIDNVSDYMQICDCVVLASNEETFGLVLIEAMHVGTAVIGTNSGGVPEIIEHEKTGLLFPPRDADALAAQIERYAENSDFRNRMAMAGKELALKKFNQDNHYQQLENFLIDLA